MGTDRLRDRTLVFDLGGVLVRWDPQRVVSLLTPDPDEQAAVLQDLFGHEDWHEYDCGFISIGDVAERLQQRTGIRLPSPERLHRAHVDSLDPLEDTVALLGELSARRIKLYCLSNVSREAYEDIAQRNPFCTFFKGVVISGDVGLTKPDPRIYRHLLVTHGLNARNSVMIDDRPENVAAAEALGMQGILFASAEQCRRELGL